MKRNSTGQLTLENLEVTPFAYGPIILNKEMFIQVLAEIDALNNLSPIKDKVIVLKDIVTHPKNDRKRILNIDANGDTISLRRDILISELNQILEAKTPERAKYYLKRLENGVKKIKTSKINDVNLLRWKEYDEITTDSLWILGKRDTSGVHLG